jgi:hypothetical protein
MEFTGERFIPEIQGQIELEHLHRYLLAKTLARGANVLDIVSGEGLDQQTAQLREQTSINSRACVSLSLTRTGLSS